MPVTDAWDIAIWGAAGYLAIVALVRLMRNHRQAYVSRLMGEIEQQRRQQEREEAKKTAATKKQAKPAAK